MPDETSSIAGSRATNTDPRYAKLTIGVCPDQWGVWFSEDEKQIPWATALDEMAAAGFSVMETGPFGYFPKDPKRLQEEMDRRGFRVVAGTGFGILHQPEAWAETEATFNEFGEQSFYASLVRPLVNRLQIEDWYARHPEIDEQDVHVELLGVGFPRTGSTALSHLLAEDRSFRNLRLWEEQSPCPPPGPTSSGCTTTTAATR